MRSNKLHRQCKKSTLDDRQKVSTIYDRQQVDRNDFRKCLFILYFIDFFLRWASFIRTRVVSFGLSVARVVPFRRESQFPLRFEPLNRTPGLSRTRRFPDSGKRTIAFQTCDKKTTRAHAVCRLLARAIDRSMWLFFRGVKDLPIELWSHKNLLVNTSSILCHTNHNRKRSDAVTPLVHFLESPDCCCDTRNTYHNKNHGSNSCLGCIRRAAVHACLFVDCEMCTANVVHEAWR